MMDPELLSTILDEIDLLRRLAREVELLMRRGKELGILPEDATPDDLNAETVAAIFETLAASLS